MAVDDVYEDQARGGLPLPQLSNLQGQTDDDFAFPVTVKWKFRRMCVRISFKKSALYVRPEVDMLCVGKSAGAAAVWTSRARVPHRNRKI